MAHILNPQDISRLQRIFLGSNLLSNNQYLDGVWCYNTKRAYEGWCVSHGILTIAAKIQPHSLESLPLPLQTAMSKFFEQEGTEPKVEPSKVKPTVVEAPVVVSTPAPVIEEPVIEPIVEPVAETTPVQETVEPVQTVETPVEATMEEKVPVAKTEEKRTLNNYKK